MTSKPHAFLMNCWYVAAWDHEMIDGRLLARTILGQPVVLYKGDSGTATAARRPLLSPWRPAVERPPGR